MKTVIEATGLGKKYILSHRRGGQHDTLRDALTASVKGWGRRFRKSRPGEEAGDPRSEEFWALSDVSLEVRQGDRLGIIGRNGAGKSTLLKILSRITLPTTGKVRIRGRTATLLEVGTGFHPELTGRENIFLNGAILGMRAGEIRKNFDSIVDFAEVEKFLDTPVKRYSSGMYVRLAFAVAAHLDPEILLVDEVLAVGDARFQKKCLGKMEDLGKEGRTVLFVSHNMNAIEQLCTGCLVLDNGRVSRHSEDVRSVVVDYLFHLGNEPSASEWVNDGPEFANPWFRPLRIAITDSAGRNLPMPVSNDQEAWVRVEGEISELDPALTVGYAMYAEDGTLLYWSFQTDSAEETWPALKTGRCALTSRIPSRWFNEGTYRIELIGSLHFRKWLLEPGRNAPGVFLTISGGLSDSPHWMAKRPGTLAPVLPWNAVD